MNLQRIDVLDGETLTRTGCAARKSRMMYKNTTMAAPQMPISSIITAKIKSENA